MATIWVECWKCDVCGFRWIKDELWPDRCKSSACRSRKWNSAAKSAPSVEPKPEREPMVFKPRSAGASDLAVGPGDTCAMPAAKPGLAELRAMVSTLESKPVAAILEPAAALEPCPLVAQYGDTGEWFACSLHAGHKSNHSKGEKRPTPDEYM